MHAEEVTHPFHFYGHYDFNYAGIALGSLVLGIETENDHYKVHLQVISEGIVNLFTRHVNDTIAWGRHENGRYMPEYYESYYKTKHKPRHIKLEFDKKGAVTTELNVPPEDRNDRPEIPHSLKDGSYDPLAGMLALRAGNTDIKAFDAKRLYEVTMADKGEDKVYAAHEWRRARVYVLSRKPLSGMTKKEMKEYEQGEPPLYFYFSNDKDRIPLKVRLPLMIGNVKGTLVKTCKTWDECAMKVDAK